MELERLPDRFSICQLRSAADADWSAPFCFFARTDEELSLVCRTEDVPADTAAREDGWRGCRVRGTLDFSLVGILSGLTGVLAARGIGIFAVSTYNTDYLFVKAERFDEAMSALSDAGHTVL